jgi:hypothetical protein
MKEEVKNSLLLYIMPVFLNPTHTHNRSGRNKALLRTTTNQNTVQYNGGNNELGTSQYKMVIKFANLNAKDNLVPLIPCIRPSVTEIYTYYTMYSFYLITI